MTVDPAGYGDGKGKTKSKLAKQDEHAISVCEVSSAGWFYHKIIHGRWDIRETSLRIVKTARDFRPAKVGIEAGALKNAIMPYIVDQQRRLGVFFNVIPLTHGGKKKSDRIMWSLQGRLENGRIFFKEGESWHKAVFEQMNQFPNPLAHDDIIDSMAYVDQLGGAVYNVDSLGVEEENWDDIYWEV
jgi:predicted phage terminase large subunit-like protein